MRDKTKKAIVLKNLSSPYVSEAIIFLKPEVLCDEPYALLEAERIISKYFNTQKSDAIQKSELHRRDSLAKFALTAVISAALSFAACYFLSL